MFLINLEEIENFHCPVEFAEKKHSSLPHNKFYKLSFLGLLPFRWDVTKGLQTLKHLFLRENFIESERM